VIRIAKHRKVLVMRNAETVLEIIHKRGRKGLPLEDIYRQLYNPDLYLRAYARLYSNKGAMTKGTTSETVDGMSLAKIEKLIDDLRHERYRWTAVRRIRIPKKNGKRRPLGIPTWSDKLLQEVIRLLLEAYYEPQMSDHSHGFRPERGCHTALNSIKHTWTGTKWFIEGDITGCFDHIDHQVMLSILQEKLHDKRFVRLLDGLLKAGYLEQWKYHTTLSGTPQGGVLSPLLANIYLDRLDRFVETVLLPTYNRKAKRRKHPLYTRMASRVSKLRKKGRKEEAARLRKHMLHLPSYDPDDPEYRRLRYVRYADDFLLGFAGPLAEAEEIRAQLGTFLHEELRLELNQEKTLITHAQTGAAHFLGYEIATHHANDKLGAPTWQRTINGKMELRVPAAVIEANCAKYMAHGKPIHRAELIHESDYAITEKYQWKYRGLMQYYALAVNIAWLSKLHYVMRTSLLKTLAHKHKSTVNRMVKKYQTDIETPYGKMKCLEVRIERREKKPLVARFGGIPWRRQATAILHDINPQPVVIPRNELIKRLLQETCELCGSKENISVHHIRGLKDLQGKGRRDKPLWVQVMAAMRRKTLVVCGYCHWAIETGKPTRQPTCGK
jgi:group II intron reverse transcriptase/maturase